MTIESCRSALKIKIIGGTSGINLTGIFGSRQRRCLG
jgi:hypothetical protein